MALCIEMCPVHLVINIISFFITVHINYETYHLVHTWPFKMLVLVYKEKKIILPLIYSTLPSSQA